LFSGENRGVYLEEPMKHVKLVTKPALAHLKDNHESMGKKGPKELPNGEYEIPDE
jgi:hypothetical protein